MSNQKSVVVPYLLAGGGDVHRFFIPLAAHEWVLSVLPGNYRIPPRIIEDLRPFASDKEDFNKWSDSEFYAGRLNTTNDVALTLAKVLHNYESARAQAQDVVLNDWIVSEQDYVGLIY